MNSLTGTTTREILFTVTDHHSRQMVETRRFPAGTTVYARENRNGRLTVRVPGTLFEQDVYASSVEPA